MDVTTTHAVLWSHLTTAQKEHGIHPDELGKIQFDLNENELSELVSKQLEHFFMGCRVAASEQEFLAKSIHILNSTEQELQPIKAVATRALFASAPKDSSLEGPGEDVGSVHFEGEGFGSPYRDYKNKFAKAYNQLIEEKKCHWMHPARRSELIPYLQPLFSHPEVAADRLIYYRCFGNYGLLISEYERSLQKYSNEIQQVQMQLNALFEKGPCLIKNPLELQEDSLDCIPTEYCRKYVCLAYRSLASQNKLDILDLPVEKLYDYYGGQKADTHPDLAALAEAYNNEVSGGNKYHYGVVVKYLKTLRNSDLRDLMKLCLDEELERLQWLKNFSKDRLEDSKINYQNQLKLYRKDPESYKPGDFSFSCDPLTIRILTNAYNAVEKLQAWPFFDQDPPEKKGYMFWDHPMVHKIGKALSSDGHSGASMGFTMRWMQRIRKLGWNASVREVLEKNAKQLGSLNKAKL